MTTTFPVANPCRLVFLAAALALTCGVLHASPESLLDPFSQALLQQANARPAVDFATVTIRFQPGMSPGRMDAAVASLRSRVVRNSLFTRGLRIITVPPGHDVASTIARLRQRPDVVYAEPTYLDHPCFVPNDPLFVHQWNMAMIQMATAWDIVPSRGNGGVKVAVVDTGVAFESYSDAAGTYAVAPDLSGLAFVSPKDVVDGDTHPNDLSGHGTHVCGTIAQRSDNARGVAGMADGVAIMPIRSLGPGGGTHVQFSDALHWAVDNGARVVNYSGGGSDSITKRDAVKYAYDRNVLVVAAMGNEGKKNPPAGFPGRYAECLGVGAVDRTQALAYYSNYGDDVDVVAPGGDTRSSEANGIIQNTFSSGSPTSFGYYGYMGTSMATPHVTGLAALLLTQNPALTRQQLVEKITGSAQDLGTSGWDQKFGHGLINAAASLGGAAGGTPPIISNIAPEAPTVTINPPQPIVADSLLATATARDADGDPLTYGYEWSKWTGSTWGTWSYATADGRLIGVTLQAGEQWKARARAHDGEAYSAWAESAPVSVSNPANTAPTAPKVAYDPAKPVAGGTLRAVATATDAEGDSLTYLYQWATKVGNKWGAWGYESTDGILRVTLRKGQTWRAQTKASDGRLWSGWTIGGAVSVQAAPSGRLRVAAAVAPTGLGGAQVAVTLSEQASVSVSICNLAGRAVTVLPEQVLSAGTSSILWNGKTAAGLRPPAGAYLLRITACAADGRSSHTVASLNLRR